MNTRLPPRRSPRPAWATCLVVVVPIAACTGKSAAAADPAAVLGASTGPTASAAPHAPAAWSATLSPPAAYAGPGHVTGTANVAAPGAGTSAGGAEVATVSITGAVPNSVHPWHVHRGTCGADSGIVGGAKTYPVMRTDASGAGRATATVPTPLAAGGSYMVNVHASPADLKTIVACGPLTAGGR